MMTQIVRSLCLTVLVTMFWFAVTADERTKREAHKSYAAGFLSMVAYFATIKWEWDKK